MIDLTYTPAQEEVFFQAQGRFIIVSKGRRVGFTRGAAQAFIEKAMEREMRFLWGETIFSNVQRYIDLYFKPILDQLPDGMWNWNGRLMQMRINNSVIDFRSADNPENWEGFGYHFIFLNEAGIILKDPDLFKNTVLPMLMDYSDSRLIAAGVPKGKKIKNGEIHPFFKLWIDNPNSRYNFSSYSNPFINKADVDELAGALDELTRQQEIFGEFIDATDSPYLYAFKEEFHTIESYEPNLNLDLLVSFDFNKEPMTAVVAQQPTVSSLVIFDEIKLKSGSTPEVCDILIAKYPQWHGRIDVTGDATGRNRSSMVRGNINHYIIIQDKMNLLKRQLIVPTANPTHVNSRILCNSVLQNANVKITKNCTMTINDCIYAQVDEHGELVKTQMEGRHFFDNFRYLIEAAYKDFIKSPHKYQEG